MILTKLSLVNVTGRRWPNPTPTNEQRLQAFRAVSVPEIGNGYDWQKHAEQAKEAKQ